MSLSSQTSNLVFFLIFMKLPTDLVPDELLFKLAQSFTGMSEMRGFFMCHLKLTEAEIQQNKSDQITETYYHLLRTWKRNAQQHATISQLLHLVRAGKIDTSSQHILEQGKLQLLSLILNIISPAVVT